MNKIFIIVMLAFLAASCNQELYKPIGQKKCLNHILQESALAIYPIYSYQEYVSHKPQDKKSWIFAEDSLSFFKTFHQQLEEYFEKNKGVSIKSFSNLSYNYADSCFGFLARGSVDSFETYITANSNLQALTKDFAILDVEFIMNKEGGTSGLGPMGDFSPFGSYYIHFFAVRSNKLVYYKSMLRRASFFNRFYTPKRSRNAIKAFFN